MNKLARLAGLVALTILAVGLMSTSTAFAGYLLLPVGAEILGLSLPGFLEAGANRVRCQLDHFTAKIADPHLVGPFRVDFLECESSANGTTFCPVRSTNTTALGLILTNTLHALIGLGLVNGQASPALLFLPTEGKTFTILASNACTPETAITGRTAALLLAPVNQLFRTALLHFAKNDPEKIVLPLNNETVEPELVAFSVRSTLNFLVHLQCHNWCELMP